MDSKLRDIIVNPDSADIESFESVIRRYPYFAQPGIELLKLHGNELDKEKSDKLKFHLAVVTGDRQALFEQTEGRDFENIYPKTLPQPPVTTESALETFFATYGTSSATEDALLEKLIFNPTPEYAEILVSEDDNHGADKPEEGSLEACIDNFIASRKKTAAAQTNVAVPPPPVEAEPQAAADSSLSESLAKIFVKQGRYERAYEIISNLSLKNQKKSIYFADQLRFLQKLIKIQQFAERNEDIQKQRN